MSEIASRTKFYPKGPIFREGDAGNTMYLIKSGRVKVTKNVHGIMVKIADLGPGDYFGEMAILEDTPRSASALADTQVEVVVLDRKAFVEHIAKEPEFAIAMMREMSHRLREIDDRLTDLVARGRLPQADASQITQHAVH